jgi:hypothetical protein
MTLQIRSSAGACEGLPEDRLYSNDGAAVGQETNEIVSTDGDAPAVPAGSIRRWWGVAHFAVPGAVPSIAPSTAGPTVHAGDVSIIRNIAGIRVEKGST